MNTFYIDEFERSHVEKRKRLLNKMKKLFIFIKKTPRKVFEELISSIEESHVTQSQLHAMLEAAQALNKVDGLRNRDKNRLIELIMATQERLRMVDYWEYDYDYSPAVRYSWGRGVENNLQMINQQIRQNQSYEDRIMNLEAQQRAKDKEREEKDKELAELQSKLQAEMRMQEKSRMHEKIPRFEEELKQRVESRRERVQSRKNNRGPGQSCDKVLDNCSGKLKCTEVETNIYRCKFP